MKSLIKTGKNSLITLMVSLGIFSVTNSVRSEDLSNSQKALINLSTSRKQTLTSANNSFSKDIRGRINDNKYIAQRINIDRFSLGGIKLLMTESQVRKILGRPKKVENRQIDLYDMTGNEKTKFFYYSGLEIMLLDAGTGFFVFSINADKSKYSTSEGVKVGDSLAKVLKTYGQPKNKEQSDKYKTELWLSYNVRSNRNNWNHASLVFHLEKNKVKGIYIGFPIAPI